MSVETDPQGRLWAVVNTARPGESMLFRYKFQAEEWVREQVRMQRHAGAGGDGDWWYTAEMPRGELHILGLTPIDKDWH